MAAAFQDLCCQMFVNLCKRVFDDGADSTPPHVVSRLLLPDETKIETEQEEDEMDDGAATADLRCFDETCPQQRHRYIGEIEIEQNARRHEERACQKFTKVPVSPGD